MTGPPSRARVDPEAKLTGLSREGGPASRPAPTVSVLSRHCLTALSGRDSGPSLSVRAPRPITGWCAVFRGSVIGRKGYGGVALLPGSHQTPGYKSPASGREARVLGARSLRAHVRGTCRAARRSLLWRQVGRLSLGCCLAR